MSARSGEREAAIQATEAGCPRCGSERERAQRYCLECGLTLPELTGRVPALRHRWLRRFGWYPGDWIWLALATLPIAIVGAVAAVVLSGDPHGSRYVVALDGPVRADVQPSAGNGTAAKLVAWPANENGWTIVLVSYPKTNGRPSALASARAATAASLQQVGILDSSLFASLQPGYLVVFTGVYSAQSDADAGVSTARQAGFGGAYSRQISR